MKFKGIGQSINKIVKETNDNVKIDKKSRAWIDYQEYINDIVFQRISESINKSLCQIKDFVSVDSKNLESQIPWFEISFLIRNNQKEFFPKFSMDEMEFNIRKMIGQLVQDTINISSNIHRLD